MRINYKEDEKVFSCDMKKGMLLQNKLMKLISEMGAKLSKFPDWKAPAGSASIMLPRNKHENVTPKIALSLGYYSPKQTNGIMAVLHELGHLQDCHQHGGLQEMVRIKGYHNIEIEAWENAFQLAHKIGFKDFDDLLEISLKSLYTYFDTEGTPRLHRMDRVFRYTQKPTSWSEAYNRLLLAHSKATKRVNEILYAC